MPVDVTSLPSRFGPYVLVRALGGGGMGNVFLGVYGAAGAEKLCVVKRLIPETLTDTERRARFRREADIVRRLSHGAIAKTLAVDEVDGEPYIAQEYLEGRTLAQVLTAAQGVGHQLAIPVAVHIVREVARALAYAHRLDGRGIVHRDIAPENIMLTFSGEVRLIDFGIARAPTDPSLTEPGIVVGRQSYTAPELLRGAIADGRADVYSLGVVLWELLAGRHLMLGELGKAPAPSSIPTALPGAADLDHVVLRAVAAKIGERYQTIEDLQRALGAFVPQGFVGEPGVGEFIRSCYDVETERAHVAEAVAEARQFLPRADEPPAPSRALGGRRGPLAVAFVMCGAVVAVVGLALSRGRLKGEPQLSRTVAPAVVMPVAAHVSPPALPPPVIAAEQPVAPIAPVALHPIAPSAKRQPAGPGPGALLDRARDSFQMGDLGAADRDARALLRSNATAAQKARAQVIVGQISLLGGRRAEAETAFATAVQLDPSNESAAAALARARRRPGGGGQP